MFLRSKSLYLLIFFPPQEGLKIINNYPMVSLITYKLKFHLTASVLLSSHASLTFFKCFLVRVETRSRDLKTSFHI